MDQEGLRPEVLRHAFLQRLAGTDPTARRGRHACRLVDNDETIVLVKHLQRHH
jgi:hypothetical protein